MTFAKSDVGGHDKIIAVFGVDISFRKVEVLGHSKSKKICHGPRTVNAFKWVQSSWVFSQIFTKSTFPLTFYTNCTDGSTTWGLVRDCEEDHLAI